MKPADTTMTDLGILELHIKATTTQTITAHMGRAAQFACLQAVRSQDDDLAQRLHDGHGLKPYTVSGLLQGESSRSLNGIIQPGAVGRIRFTSLSAAVFQVMGRWAAHSSALELNHNQWEITETRWKQTHSYADIITTHELAPPKEKINIRFTVPTCFKSMGQYFPMPTPRLVFGNLIDRWQAFSGVPVPTDFHDFVEQYIVVGDYDLRTQPVVLKQGTQIKGCVGKVSYMIAKRNHTFEKNHPIRAASVKQNRIALIRLTGMLAEFANYSGLGIKTTQGMGTVSIS